MSTITTLGVTGMTCANCVSHVTTELSEVTGVENVTVQLRTGGVSEVSVFSDDPLPEDALREAIDEAGYEIDSLAVQTDAMAVESTPGSAEGCGCDCGNAAD